MTIKLPVQKVLALDALTCVIAGLVMAFGAARLAPLTGLPAHLLLVAGVALFPVAALFGWLARTARLPVPLLWLAILGNLAWVLASIVVIEIFDPTLFGSLFVAAQAAVVLLLTVAEWRGLAAVRAATA